mmetsp:Transcript_4925/g.9769  ORF Transcript_4925/g.9769 Transcript_4925/m.9769 type:complete len:150 (+) Transcript_4925:40-489(+)
MQHKYLQRPSEEPQIYIRENPSSPHAEISQFLAPISNPAPLSPLSMPLARFNPAVLLSPSSSNRFLFSPSSSNHRPSNHPGFNSPGPSTDCVGTRDGGDVGRERRVEGESAEEWLLEQHVSEGARESGRCVIVVAEEAADDVIVSAGDT